LLDDHGTDQENEAKKGHIPKPKLAGSQIALV
jgi:hypothetical protein